MGVGYLVKILSESIYPQPFLGNQCQKSPARQIAAFRLLFVPFGNLSPWQNEHTTLVLFLAKAPGYDMTHDFRKQKNSREKNNSLKKVSYSYIRGTVLVCV